jgi:hypothetical protein
MGIIWLLKTSTSLEPSPYFMELQAICLLTRGSPQHCSLLCVWSYYGPAVLVRTALFLFVFIKRGSGFDVPLRFACSQATTRPTCGRGNLGPDFFVQFSGAKACVRQSVFPTSACTVHTPRLLCGTSRARCRLLQYAPAATCAGPPPQKLHLPKVCVSPPDPISSDFSFSPRNVPR